MIKTKAEFPTLIQAVVTVLEAIGQRERVERLYYQFLIRLHQAWAKLRPGNPWHHHNLAKVLLQQKRWAEAVQAGQQAIALDPSCAWFYHTLAEAYSGQGMWPEAVTAAQAAIAREPQTAWFYHNLAKAYMGQEAWDDAIPAINQAIALDPSVFWFHYTLGEALVKHSQWDAAIPTLQRAIELQPQFPWSYYYLGEALLAKDQVEAAIALYRQAITLHPQVDYLQHCLDYALHLQDQWQRIQTYCQEIQAQDAEAETTGNEPPLKVLMLTPYPPYPPKLGAIARMFHELKNWGDRHRLVVVSFIFSKEDYWIESALSEYCDLAIMVMIGDPLPRQPDQPKLIHRYSSQRMEKILQALAAVNFDIASFNFIYMAQYRKFFPEAYPVLGEHNIESRLLKRCAEVHQDSSQIQQIAQETEAVKAFVESHREAQLLEAYENQHWPQFPLRCVVSELDRQELRDRCSVGQTLVVNNGIDTATVDLLPENASQNILFIGTLSYYPNIDGACYFAEAILPLIWQQDPTVNFYIAGSDPPTTITDLGQDPRIQVIANPEDMSAIAQACSLTVVPLRIGSGTRIKIIHSMAMGLPVVSTRLGCEGLAVEDGVHLLVRDQPQDFAQAVLQLLNDARLRQELRHQGRTLVEQTYDWQEIFQDAERQILKNFQAWKNAKVKAIA